MAAKVNNNLVISLRDHLLSVDPLKRGTDDSQKIRLILASQSPRRREILDMMGLQNLFETIPSPLDEDSVAASLEKDDPIEYTRHLAEQKALALANSISLSNPTLVLGSDTIVAYSNKILEKPVDKQDAIRMLKELQGNQHMVHTGVALVDGMTLVDSFTVTANVRFAELSDADIEAYVNTGEPMDKSGAYGIQGIGGQIVESIDGDFFTVMGLPMRQTSQALARAITTILNRRSNQS
jgi:septum formation protein